MAFDGFVTKSIVNELSQTIINGKVNKVFEPNLNEIILNIYLNSKKYNLSFNIDCSNCRINLTSNLKENPVNPPSFCMLLRKYLEGNKIIDIYSIKLDRIIVIKFEGYDSANKNSSVKSLVIELMGKHSNMILLNDKNIIIDSMRHITSSNSYRRIFPGELYTFPVEEKKDFSLLSFEEFFSIANSSNDLITALQNNFIGFSKSYASYILNKLKIDSSSFTKNDIQKLYDYLVLLLNNIDNGNVCCYHYNFNNQLDFVIDTCSESNHLIVNHFIDEFYSKKENNEAFIFYRNNLLKMILSNLKKLKKKLEGINLKLDECSHMNKYKLYGELITANLYRLDNNHHLDYIELENYYDNNNLLKIELDKKYLPSQNAKLFFKKYNKLKNAFKIVSLQKKEIKLEIDYLESIIYCVESSSNIKDIEEIYIELYENNIIKSPQKKSRSNKNKTKSKFTFHPIKLNLNGFDVLIGRNNKENDYLTLKFASKEDVWFHTKDIHGSHVVLRINHKIPKDDILIKCAQIAAFYSKAKNSSKVLVEYTKIKNITKPKGSKPGFVVFSSYKTLMVEPQKITD